MNHRTVFLAIIVVLIVSLVYTTYKWIDVSVSYGYASSGEEEAMSANKRLANGPHSPVGPLGGNDRSAEVGIVVPPDSLVYRMKNGVYDFYYPEPG